jgi:membrane protein required for colicin V production
MMILGVHWPWVDIAMMVVVLLSTLISLLRGFVKEALSLATWIAALVVGRFFSPKLAVMLEKQISLPSARLAAAFAILFFGTLIVGALINQLISQLVKVTGLSGTDRLLGMLFGCARGVLVVVVIIGILSMTVVVNDPWWKESTFIPMILPMWDWAKTFVAQFSETILKTQP